MAGFLVRWAANIIALVAVTSLVPGIRADTAAALVTTALVLGLLNAVVRPLIIFLTLPLYIVSLGLATLFVNAFLFYLASRLVTGFHVAHFWAAFWGAFLFSAVTFLVNILVYPALSLRVTAFRTGAGRKRPYTDVIDVTPDRTGSKKRG